VIRESGFAVIVALIGCSAKALDDDAAIVELGSRTVTLDVGLDDDLRRALSAGDVPRVQGLMRFESDLTPQDHEAIESAGIVLIEFLTPRIYSASIPTNDEGAQGVVDSLVRAGTIVLPNDKKHVALREAAAVTDGTAVDILFRTGVTADAVTRCLGDFKVSAKATGITRQFRAEVNHRTLDGLAGDDRVQWIEPSPKKTRQHGETARAWTHVDRTQSIFYSSGSPPVEFLGLSGKGVVVAVADTGIDEGHADFFEIGTTNTRVNVPAPNANGDHGTFVAALVGAQGVANSSLGFPKYAFRGQAPEVRFVETAFVNGNEELSHLIVETRETDLSNHSYSISPATTYDGAHVASIDRIIRGDGSHNGQPIRPRPQVFSAGNLGDGDPDEFLPHSGYYSIEAVAKNSIAVGSIDTFDGRLSRTSSLGPTIDGRIKPDLVAPGAFDSIVDPPVGLYAAKSGGGHANTWGTSNSAGVVSGILALVAQQRNAIGFDADSMLSSTYKAILIAAAIDAVEEMFPPANRQFLNSDTGLPVRYHVGPDWATGFGIVDAPRAVELTKDERWREAMLVAKGQSHLYCMTVPAGAAELRVALAWDDEPGSLILGAKQPRLVNDLDLEMTDPNGVAVLPWTLVRPPQAAEAWKDGLDPIKPTDLPPATRGPYPDRVNNVELISVPEPQPGTWSIKVKLHHLGGTDPQLYSLAASHQMGFCPLVPPIPWPPTDIICKKFKFLCEFQLVFPEPIFDLEERTWLFDQTTVLSMGRLRTRVDVDGEPRSIAATGLPDRAELHVIDDTGRVLVEATSEGGVVHAEFDGGRPGHRQFILITGSMRQPLEAPTRVRIDLNIESDG